MITYQLLQALKATDNPNIQITAFSDKSVINTAKIDTGVEFTNPAFSELSIYGKSLNVATLDDVIGLNEFDHAQTYNSIFRRIADDYSELIPFILSSRKVEQSVPAFESYSQMMDFVESLSITHDELESAISKVLSIRTISVIKGVHYVINNDTGALSRNLVLQHEINTPYRDKFNKAMKQQAYFIKKYNINSSDVGISNSVEIDG